MGWRRLPEGGLSADCAAPSMTPIPLAVIAEVFGPPSSFSIRPFDPGAPATGEIRVAIRCAGISFVDVLTAAGGYQVKPPLPLIPGSEFAGVVESIGDGVADFRIGDRVCGAAMTGALAERIVLPSDRLHKIAAAVPFEEAAVFRASYSTAYHALVQRAHLTAGETLLVLGASGAVGHAAVQVGKWLGARVIASASSQRKREAALAAGADVAIDSAAADWGQRVKDACSGKPLDVVCDPVGGTATEPAFRSLGWNGRLLVIGFAGGSIPKLGTNLALLKGASLIGVDIRQFEEREHALSQANLDYLFKLQTTGQFRPHVAQTFPIAHFAAAMELAGQGSIPGRIVVTMPG
jgi:NADPH:quinone reductase